MPPDGDVAFGTVGALFTCYENACDEVTTFEKANIMTNRSYNAFDTAQHQFDQMADILELDKATRDLLRWPMREYHFSIPVRMDDGSELEYGPGDAFYMPPGHDAWIVGDEQCVMLDVTGMSNYAKA